MKSQLVSLYRLSFQPIFSTNERARIEKKDPKYKIFHVLWCVSDDLSEGAILSTTPTWWNSAKAPALNSAQFSASLTGPGGVYSADCKDRPPSKTTISKFKIIGVTRKPGTRNYKENNLLVRIVTTEEMNDRGSCPPRGTSACRSE